MGRTVTVKLLGGLGNQMFQYAAARALADRCNMQLALDTSWFVGGRAESDTPREFELDRFTIRADRILYDTPSQYKTFQHLAKMRGLSLVFDKVIKAHIWNESAISVATFTTKFPSQSIYLTGYWQSAHYFSDDTPALRADFSLREPMAPKLLAMRDQILSSNAVAIHVRRGDYVSNPNANAYHGVLPNTYYTNAIDFINQRTTSAHYFIFSDDPVWVKNNLLSGQASTVVSDGYGKSYEELLLMSLCKHNIIANSSFSWWSAWLNPNPHKIVVAPVSWTTQAHLLPSQMIPQDWIRL